VIECAIFPRKDDRFGEIVACAVVTKQHDSISISSIKEWCHQNGLAGYKRPKILFFLETLPRNSSGKILKHKLVAQFGSIIRSKL
ncbi:MAG: acyl-CoA synthetase (AMP-forming)/AMP-acid ligase II, partial [Bacillariaceae sp.]|jgi:acyl-CoA synthetase (AMP-forming)/AMP-acid ligase II